MQGLLFLNKTFVFLDKKYNLAAIFKNRHAMAYMYLLHSVWLENTFELWDLQRGRSVSWLWVIENLDKLSDCFSINLQFLTPIEDYDSNL